MTNKKNDKLLKLVILFMCSIIISMILVWASSIDLIGLCQKQIIYKSTTEKSFSPNELDLKGYLVNGEEFNVITNDPQIEIKNKNGAMSNLTIEFAEKTSNDLIVQVYFCDLDSEYSEENSVILRVPAYSKFCKTDISKKNISNVRIDIGTSVGESFELSKIILNDERYEITFWNDLENATKTISLGRFFCQLQLIVCMVFFVGLHFVLNISQMYKNIFKKRWIVAGVVLLFLVVNKFHGESLAVYDSVIQPGVGNEYVEPILGKERIIRSDDFVVETPNKMASIIDGKFGKYNNIARGTETLNSVNGIYVGYSTIGRSPFQFVYKILGGEYAYSFCWYAPIILCFMVAIEFFFILSKRNALVAMTGACLEILSSFYLWWGFPSFVLGAQASIVCVYYFINVQKLWKKILLGLGVAIAFANYVLSLYPAWIVPMGYVVLCFLVWIIYEQWNKIKVLKKGDWIIIIVMFIFAVSVIVSYFILNQEYMYAITNTLYPGKRICYGGYALDKLLLYSQSYLYAFREIGNPAEASVILNFFPIPTIVVFVEWIKEKKKDWLVGGLLLLSIVFLIYVTFGVPEFFAKITLLSTTTEKRLIDILAIIQLYFIVIILSDSTKYVVSNVAGIIMSIVTAFISILSSKSIYPNFLSWKWMVVSFGLILIVGVTLSTRFGKTIQNGVCVGLITLSIICSFCIRPISKGFDAITSKPVSAEISKIVDNDGQGKWIAYGGSLYLPGFSIANGAPTINSTNTYPNLKLWKKLDKEKQYEEIYNRYTHVIIEFTDEDTSFELLYPDQMKVNLSYKDLKKTETKYVLTVEKLDINNSYVNFEEIYNEYGAYIYKINYLK